MFNTTIALPTDVWCWYSSRGNDGYSLLAWNIGLGMFVI